MCCNIGLFPRSELALRAVLRFLLLRRLQFIRTVMLMLVLLDLKQVVELSLSLFSIKVNAKECIQLLIWISLFLKLLCDFFYILLEIGWGWIQLTECVRGFLIRKSDPFCIRDPFLISTLLIGCHRVLYLCERLRVGWPPHHLPRLFFLRLHWMIELAALPVWAIQILIEILALLGSIIGRDVRFHQ